METYEQYKMANNNVAFTFQKALSEKETPL